MALKKKLSSPAEGEFLFEIDETPLEETLTSFGGLPLFLRAARSLGLGASVKRNVRIKQRQRGLEEAAYVESFLALNAVGGECLKDFAVLRKTSAWRRCWATRRLRRRRRASFSASSTTMKRSPKGANSS